VAYTTTVLTLNYYIKKLVTVGDQQQTARTKGAMPLHWAV